MYSITVKGSDNTPSIKFDAKQGTLEIKGRSLPENAAGFYLPMLETVDQYLKKPLELTRVDIYLDYCNTSSSRHLLRLLRMFKDAENKGNKVVVNWYYEAEDEEIRDVGKGFQTITGMTFNMEPK